MGWVVGGAMWVWAGLWVEAWLWVGGGVWAGLWDGGGARVGSMGGGVAMGWGVAMRRGRGYGMGCGYGVGAWLWGGGVARHLLAQQVVVHLQALRLLEGLLQALVALPQLPHVIARLR